MSARSRRGVLGLALAALLGAGSGGIASWAAQRGWVQLPELDLDRALRAPGLRLRRVEFMGLARLHAGELVEWAKLAPGPLAELDPGLVVARLSSHPRIERAEAVRVPPDRLLVEVVERVPVAVGTDGATGIDAGGERFPIDPEEAQGLTRIHGPLAAALPLLAAARAREVALAEIRAEAPGELSFRPVGRPTLVRVGDDPERAITDWLRLHASGLLDRHAAGEVDLRFEGNAVLRDLREDTGGV